MRGESSLPCHGRLIRRCLLPERLPAPHRPVVAEIPGISNIPNMQRQFVFPTPTSLCGAHSNWSALNNPVLKYG